MKWESEILIGVLSTCPQYWKQSVRQAFPHHNKPATHPEGIIAQEQEATRIFWNRSFVEIQGPREDQGQVGARKIEDRTDTSGTGEMMLKMVDGCFQENEAMEITVMMSLIIVDQGTAVLIRGMAEEVMRRIGDHITEVVEITHLNEGIGAETEATPLHLEEGVRGRGVPWMIMKPALVTELSRMIE